MKLNAKHKKSFKKIVNSNQNDFFNFLALYSILVEKGLRSLEFVEHCLKVLRFTFPFVFVFLFLNIFSLLHSEKGKTKL